MIDEKTTKTTELTDRKATKTFRSQFKREAINVSCTLVASIMSAFGMHYFVGSADFAPAGLDGVATMIAYRLGDLNPAYFILALNLPLLFVAWFILKKRYVIYTVLFTVMSSGIMFILEAVGAPVFTEGEGLIAAIFSGVLFGLRTGLMLRISASSGGIDIIASMINKKMPYRNIENIITAICYGIIGISYFVYDNSVMSLLLAVVQMFVFERASGRLLKENRNAVEVKIITKHPEEIKNDIIYVLKHGATVVESRGMYTEEERSMVFSVINIRQIPELFEILRKYPDTFAYYGDVSGVRGNFRWKNTDEAK
jgi:uncharacterized membrane-anchored protein YitT (DUF2179 family)